MTKQNKRIVLAALVLIVTLEALVVLKVLGLGSLPLTHFDYHVYNQLALNMLDHGVFSFNDQAPFLPTTFRSPGYPAFIAVVYLFAGRSTMALGIAQFILVGLTSILLYLLSRKLLGERESLIAGFLCATYPPIIFTAPLYIAETLSTFLVVAAMLLLVSSPPAKLLLPAGVLLGAAALARPSFVLLPLFLIPFVARMRINRAAIQALALMFIGFLLVVSPWIVRNSRLAGQILNLQTVSGWTLYVSAQQYAGEVTYRMLKPEWDRIVTEFNIRTELAQNAVPSSLIGQELLRDKEYRKDAISKLRAVSPVHVIVTMPLRLFWLWSTGDASPWQTGLYHRFQQLLYVVLVLLLAAGIWTLRRQLWDMWPLWSVPLYLTLLHLIFHVEARYTLPARPFLFPFCGVGLLALLRVRKV